MNYAAWKQCYSMTKRAAEPMGDDYISPQEQQRTMEQFGHNAVVNGQRAPNPADFDFDETVYSPEYWKRRGAATMRGLADSGWDTVQGANTLIMKGIPAAAGAMRNGVYGPVMATYDAAKNGDMGNWWNYYDRQVQQTKEDIAPMYRPANAVDNYVDSVRDYGKQNTWADPRGAEYNQEFQGLEDTARYAGDIAQFLGFSALTKVPGAAGKIADGAWRATGDPFWYSDASKMMSAAATKAPRLAKPINMYLKTTRNPWVRRTISEVGKGTELEPITNVVSNPFSLANNALNTGINESYADANNWNNPQPAPWNPSDITQPPSWQPGTSGNIMAQKTQPANPPMQQQQQITGNYRYTPASQQPGPYQQKMLAQSNTYNGFNFQ